MAVPVVESFSSGGNASNDTKTITKPTGTAEGDLLVAFVGLGRDPELTSVTLPSGWSLLIDQEDGSSSSPESKLVVGYKVAGASEPSDYTITLSSSMRWVAGIGRISGVDTGSPINVSDSVGVEDFNTTHTAPSVTTTVADCLLLCAIATRQAYEPTIPVGMSLEYDGEADFSPTLSRTWVKAASEAATSSGATGTRDFTTASGDASALASIAIAPASGGGGTTIEGAAFAGAQTFGAGALSAGPVEIIGSAFSDADAFGSGTVATDAVVITGAAFANASTFGTGEIGTGGLVVTGAATVNASAFGAGSLAAGPVEVTGAAFGNVAVFGAGVVSTDAAVISGTAFENAPDFGSGVVTAGPVTITGAAVENATVFGTGAVSAGQWVIAGAGFYNQNSFGSGALSAGVANIGGQWFANPNIFGLGMVATANQVLSGAGFENETVFGSGAFVPGAVSVAGAAFANASLFGSGTIGEVAAVASFGNSPFYVRAAATATRMIVKYGQIMVLERATNSGTPSRPSISTARTTAKAVVFEDKVWDAPNQVRRTKKVAYISPGAAPVPEPNDILEDAAGVRYEIVSVSPLNPGGTVVLYQADIGTA